MCAAVFSGQVRYKQHSVVSSKAARCGNVNLPTVFYLHNRQIFSICCSRRVWHRESREYLYDFALKTSKYPQSA